MNRLHYTYIYLKNGDLLKLGDETLCYKENAYNYFKNNIRNKGKFFAKGMVINLEDIVKVEG